MQHVTRTLKQSVSYYLDSRGCYSLITLSVNFLQSYYFFFFHFISKEHMHCV